MASPFGQSLEMFAPGLSENCLGAKAEFSFSVKNASQEADEVELLRAGSVVSSFAGAFGSSLRETRLTAILGYLIALKPNVFCDEFGITGTIESVRLEARHNQDRSDILIKSTGGLGVVEAKADATDPFEQTKKYPAKWRVLITQFLPTPNQKRIPRVEYRRWQEIADLIKENGSEFSKGEEKFVSETLISYLKEHRMIADNQAVEIYGRDLNNDETADFFLKGHIYGCVYEKGSRLTKALYFAPYFGAAVSASHPGLQEGVSYIAKILSVQVAETKADFATIAAEARRTVGFRGERTYVDQFKKWFFDGSKITYSIVFLSVPRLAFNPAIKKRYLQGGKGFLGKGYYTFDKFYRAWSGEEIF
jgi:hypothetical protein